MAVPLAPVNVTISELTSTSVKVSAQQGQSGLTSRFFYVVRTNGTGGKFVDATFVSGNIFSAVITNLTPDDQYNVSAGVFNADGQSPYSSAVTFTTWLNYQPQPQPGAPSSITDITSSSARPWTSNIQVYGRPPVLEIEMRVREVGASVYAAKTYTTVTNPPVFGSLTRATQYVAYYRVRNEVGWSDLSDNTFFTTLATVPDQPPTPSYNNVAQNAVDIYWTDPNNGGSAIIERQIQWGTDGTTFPNLVTSDGSTRVTNLTAGNIIYFRVRVRNAIGWSSYSPVRTVKLIAGAWVKWNNTWKEAVPWVKVSGVWKVATPWVRIMGVWKGVK